jgi:hypothetical protein
LVRASSSLPLENIDERGRHVATGGRRRRSGEAPRVVHLSAADGDADRLNLRGL